MLPESALSQATLPAIGRTPFWSGGAIRASREKDTRATINSTRLGTGSDLMVEETGPTIVIPFQLRNGVRVTRRRPVAGAHFDERSVHLRTSTSMSLDRSIWHTCLPPKCLRSPVVRTSSFAASPTLWVSSITPRRMSTGQVDATDGIGRPTSQLMEPSACVNVQFGELWSWRFFNPPVLSSPVNFWLR